MGHPGHLSMLREAQVIFRSLAVIATFTTVLVIFDEQIIDVTPAISPLLPSGYRLIGNSVAAGYEMLALILVSGTHCFVSFMDLMAMLLVMASAAAATAIGHVGKHGNGRTRTGWMPVCNYFEKFCNRVEYSVAYSYFGFLCLCALIAIPNSRKSSF